MKSKINDSLKQKLNRLNILKKSVTVDKEKNNVVPHQVQPCRLTLFWAKLIASGFFVGYVPVAQGTFGSLWGPVLYLLFPESWFVHFFLAVSLTLFAAVIILYFLGVWATGVCEAFWGHDPGRVVIDEIVGMFVTLSFVPLTFRTVWLGFFIFRVFDIIKPQPVRWSEKLPGGWGVMSDDVIAGIYSNIFLRIVIYFFNVL